MKCDKYFFSTYGALVIVHYPASEHKLTVFFSLLVRNVRIIHDFRSRFNWPLKNKTLITLFANKV